MLPTCSLAGLGVSVALAVLLGVIAAGAFLPAQARGSLRCSPSGWAQ